MKVLAGVFSLKKEKHPHLEHNLEDLCKDMLQHAGPESESFDGDSFVPDFAAGPKNAGEQAPSVGGVLRSFPSWFFAEKNPAAHNAFPSGLDAAEIAFQDKVLVMAGHGASMTDDFGRRTPESAKLVQKAIARMSGHMYDGDKAEQATFGVQGLFSYVYTCWAQEKNCLLSPDLIWITVLSELAREVVSNPEPYRQVFAKDSAEGGGKEKLFIPTKNVDNVDLGDIAAALRAKVKSKTFFRLATDNHFGTEGSLPGLPKVLASLMAAASSPYYDYITFMCGIPFVGLAGTRADWETLGTKLSELDRQIDVDVFRLYTARVRRRVLQILHYGFDADPSHASVFFGGMFWITTSCGSGAPYYTRGWLYEFALRNANHAKYHKYANRNKRDEPSSAHSFSNIQEFPAHLSVVPFQNLETGRRFVKCTGLFYAKEQDGWLLPRYGEFVYELLDESVKF